MTEAERDVLRLQEKDEAQQAEIDELRRKVIDLEERLERLEREPALPPEYQP